jgi:predicted  nucleic acid-binding Zn-ribbon protein
MNLQCPNCRQYGTSERHSCEKCGRPYPTVKSQVLMYCKACTYFWMTKRGKP